ncbi:MAG: Rieske 2Fe-2S domain-containing protein [Crocinitomicaceae bacterium]|nr:Rieske 2Fe-2S domain-containing protein [Crocinitomicaceae bacterium]
MKTKWVRFFSSEEELLETLGKRNSLCLELNGKNLILLRNEDQFHLIKDKCPHQGLSMKEAKCEGNYVVCPFHQYRFSLETGRGHGLYLDHYPIEFREDGVFAGFEYFSIF